jgi:hypothetical protein
MLPLILLLAVATLGLVAANSSDHPATKAGTGKFCPPADLDLETEQTIDRTLLASSDPAELRELAGAVRRRCARAADLLEAKAQALSALPAPAPSSPPFSPPPAVVPPFFTPGDIVPPPSPVNPTPPPTFTPPAPVSPPSPFTPPPPPDPAAAGITQDGRFDPGAVPINLPKAAGSRVTLNKSIQQKLVAFYGHTDVTYPAGASRLDPRRALAATGPDEGSMSFDSSQIDGKWGGNSQLALWVFQRFANSQLGASLSEDGLPGPNSEGALAEYLRSRAIAA